VGRTPYAKQKDAAKAARELLRLELLSAPPGDRMRLAEAHANNRRPGWEVWWRCAYFMKMGKHDDDATSEERALFEDLARPKGAP
jgi:hypothetical protein